MVGLKWRLGALAMLLAGCSDDGTVAAGGSSGSFESTDPGSGAVETASTTAGTSRGMPESSGGSTGGGSSSGGSLDPAESGDTDEAETGGSPELPWQPVPGTSWQWQLVGDIDTSIDVDVYDIDLFDAPQDTIDALQTQGRIVICYFSAGSYEEWRDDARDLPSAAIGDPLDGWPGEAWLDHRDEGVRTVMAARLDLAVSKGCDAVEPDNVDGYTNGTGFDLTAEDQLDYNRWLAAQAHERGLSVGLKNDVDQVEALVDDFDWALNEECVNYDECETTSPFIDQGKAVFHVEYVDDAGQGPGLAQSVCPQTGALGFSTLIKEWDLTVWRLACP